MNDILRNSDINSQDSWFGRAPQHLLPIDKISARQHLKELSLRAKELGLFRLDEMAINRNIISDFLGAVFDLSPFLRDVAHNRPEILDRLFDRSALERINYLIQSISDLSNLVEMEHELQFMAALRLHKIEAHFLIALCDLAGLLGGNATTQKVSALAIACTQAAVRFILRGAERAGKLNIVDLENPEVGCGWIILAMGKLGADELNYSSDIDLIVLFDPEANTLPDRYKGIEIFSRLTRQFVRIMQDRTADGYVFRTDLRLRPDPGSTPLAMPVEAALNYYEGRGQNWERAALIKARPIAGDISAGFKFLDELAPFIWRKFLDYAAIADVHSIKRQIHAHKGHADIAVLGHNVKLGRGGIREIEFFVQTQQLIAGGREPELRGRQTVEMLAALATKGWIEKETQERLAREYWFLRDIEHRIQMVADEQTHNIPDNNKGLLRIARLAGFKNAAAFSIRLRASLKAVEQHYAALFESAAELSEGVGNLVFTGDNDDPSTIETLLNLGFSRPSDMCRIIRTWHFGRYKATQSSEARERLTELTPALLKAFGGSAQPDNTLIEFDAFLQGLPSGIQLFALLQTNVSLLDLLITIMGAAPRLSQIITHKPHVFDGLLDPVLYRDVPTPAYLSARLDGFLNGVHVYEDILDRLRIFNAEQKFQIGVRMLTGSLHPNDAGEEFSNLAVLVLGRIFDSVIRAFAVKHGVIRHGEVGLLGLGKLGSRELTAGSDLDLVLLYEHPEDVLESDGMIPLQPAQYYARLTQRLIAALSAPTAEGVLYELDLRLRPSGNKGPIATRLSAFAKYQDEIAWTWEHMALTRARVVYAQGKLKPEIDAIVKSILKKSINIDKLYADIVEMRDLIETEKPAKNNWDIKHMRGGLIDLEFIAQAAVLSGQFNPDSDTSTKSVISTIMFPKLNLSDHNILRSALFLYSSLTQMMRVCLTQDSDGQSMSRALLALMCKASQLPDAVSLEIYIEDTAKKVRVIFNELFR